MSAVLAAHGLVKEYRANGAGVDGSARRALDGVSFEVPAGRFVSVMGPSGSGKSTLLHLLGGLDTPTAGDVVLDGRALSALSDHERTLVRRHQVGFVFQTFNLIPVLTAAENIALPAVIAGDRAYGERLERLLALTGLSDARNQLPTQLSGGQQQRVAIARALFVEPAVLLADEPTGNLDSRTGLGVLRLIKDVQRDTGQTVVLVTHDPRAAAFGDDVLFLRDGRLEGRLELDGDDDATDRVLEWLRELED